ncbi:phosphoesterase [Microbacterium phage Huwbert]|nr:phosphoesterase [Microbacterium phage Huwbert]
MVAFGTPSFRGLSTGSSPLVFDRPTDLQNGDWVVALLRCQEANSLLPWQVPAGFIELCFGPTSVSQVQSRRIGGIWAKKVTDVNAEPATYSFSCSTVRKVGALVTMKTGMAGDYALVGRGAYGGDSLASGIATLAARNNSAAPAISLVLMGSENVAGVSHVPTALPSGYTQVLNVQNTLDNSTSGSRTAIWFGYKVLSTTAFPQTSGGWAGGAGYAIYESSITGGGSAPAPTYPGVQIELKEGTSLLTVTNGAGVEVTPTLETWWPGFSSHQDMEDTYGATWAHRGGSINWAEMSEYAYDQSVIRGYAALEISCGRSSDGWWFGLHDQTTDRTSGGTFGNASAQTRAQIEQQQIVNGASGGPRPYFGLLEFIAKYGSTHLLIFDRKYETSAARTDEFLNLIAANMDTTRAVYKEFGGASATNSTKARDRGMKTWGYFYQDGYENGSLASGAVNYDYLGMDINATTAWTGPNNVNSYGKHVVGHIANSQAMYDLGMSKGATMVQCSNVAGIKAVR